MDILTGLVVWAAQATTLSLLLFVWWMRDRSQMFKLSWSFAFALLAGGLLLVGLRGQIPTFLSVEIANTMLLASIGLLIGGMQQFDGKRIDPYIAIPALIWVGGMLLPFIREDFNARVILYNVAASIGFAMGAAGSDTALETADVALMKDDLRGIPEFIALSRRTSAVLWQNIALALGLKVVFFVLALLGVATLWMAVVADVGASLLVVANGLRLLRGRARATPGTTTTQAR